MYRINISVDDVCPHPKSSLKFLNLCDGLIGEFPDIKFTFFIPMAYRLVGELEYRVDKYKKFCDEINVLSSSNFEIGWHGYNHDIWDKSFQCKNREFSHLDYKETSDIFDNMLRVAKDAGIIEKFIPVFRPPAFKISKDACLYCDNKKIIVSKSVNVNPPAKPLKLFDKTEILYHACEWDRSYFSEERCKELKNFLRDNIDSVKFVFIRDLYGR